MTSDLVRLGKRLSWLLRHGAGESGLAMDEAGWAAIEDVLVLLRVTRRQLDRVVQSNDKGRLVVEGRRVRACQGHSLAGMPVTLAGLEASWDVVHPATALWHGTKVVALDAIASEGVLPGARSHVHLAPTRDSRVGKRTSVDVLLEVSPDRLAETGLIVYRAPNGVLLARHVPVKAITGLVPMSRAGREALAASRAMPWPTRSS